LGKALTMHLLTTYEQTGIFDPTNPTQVIREAYTPNGYQSFYFNRVAPAGTLGGLGMGWSTMPGWAQVLIVGAAATAVGYFGMAKFGDSIVKPSLRKVGINLSGARSRRRRR
jgi:hypothetical protein